VIAHDPEILCAVGERRRGVGDVGQLFSTQVLIRSPHGFLARHRRLASEAALLADELYVCVRRLSPLEVGEEFIGLIADRFVTITPPSACRCRSSVRPSLVEMTIWDYSACCSGRV
jgi:hypothetical protein